VSIKERYVGSTELGSGRMPAAGAFDAIRLRAQRIADEVLWPAAATVDATGRIPAGHLDLLAESGFYGLGGPRHSGGLGVDDAGAVGRVIEALASGCLATTFVWLQHAGAVRAVAASELSGVREEWLASLCRGTRRAGAVLGGLRPGPASLVARPVPGGYRLDGEAPWVTGWGMVDVLLTVARIPAVTRGDGGDGDDVLWFLVDCRQSDVDSMMAEPLELGVVRASQTVHLTFRAHPVPRDRLVATMAYRDWPARDLAGLRTNGFLALGLTARCANLTGDGSLAAELDDCRSRLNAAAPPELPAVRADASALAVRAAALAVTTAGAPAVLAGSHPARLMREAAFLLVFGSRPGIRNELTGRLHGASPG
jgi:alkylation response protein AidB-like acyl-CoA dehydrogenase